MFLFRVFVSRFAFRAFRFVVAFLYVVVFIMSVFLCMFFVCVGVFKFKEFFEFVVKIVCEYDYVGCVVMFVREYNVKYI